VADQYNNVLREISPVPGTTNWMVSTMAGQGPETNGTANGTNTAAQFYAPAGLAFDPQGNLFLADQHNNLIRKVTPSGTNWVVSTIAGHNSLKGGSAGSTDGTNTTAQFNAPAGIAVDTNGNVYVADEDNSTIRKLTPTGSNWVTTTIGGRAGMTGASNGAGTNALFSYCFGLTVDGAGSVFVADTDNNTIRIGYPPPVIVNPTPASAVGPGPFDFTLLGPVGQVVVVQACSDLVTWTPVWTNVFGVAPLPFTDPSGGALVGRFYRAQLP
jgi:secreted PhoX family phosphatase